MMNFRECSAECIVSGYKRRAGRSAQTSGKQLDISSTHNCSTTLNHSHLLTHLIHHQALTTTTAIMSFYDSFFGDFRPFFQLLDEPYGRPSAVSRRGNTNPSSAFDDPFFSAASRMRTPAVQINEEGDHYVVEAELPGVKKEDVDVRIGDAGRSLTIEGKSVRRFGRGGNAGAEGQAGADSAANASATPSTPAAPAEAGAKDRAEGKLS